MSWVCARICVHAIEITSSSLGYERVAKAPGTYKVDDGDTEWCVLRTNDGRVYDLGLAKGVEHLLYESVGGSSTRQRTPVERFHIVEPDRPLLGKERATWLAWNYSRE